MTKKIKKGSKFFWGITVASIGIGIVLVFIVPIWGWIMAVGAGLIFWGWHLIEHSKGR
ncbi:hypothetical protein SAMN02745134_01370 [Clostridium acidisoli DSM 12555]|uniref:Uncharacterized protein n=1 Tax=Clostridium acidisoli DSM 12555 TaxID=1121291 RepID=A0A1W1XCL6_9CLOT|nr:hypothetical protein [Clostridium acidisoli]SMC21600.1 hypothetical protein SAMN02745134_01370 [Clostridium acidisoli DSM 12555]